MEEMRLVAPKRGILHKLSRVLCWFGIHKWYSNSDVTWAVCGRCRKEIVNDGRGMPEHRDWHDA